MTLIQNYKSLRKNKDIINGFKRIYRIIWKKFFITAPYPDTIDIEVCSRCNLNCIMCCKSIRSGSGNIMTFEQFKHIIDQFKFDWFHRPRFVISGLGENMLNPDILKIFKYAREKKAEIKFVDNFTLIDEKIARELIKMKIKTIQFSLDGATKKTYEKIRIGAEWETVTNNIKKFIELKKEMKSKRPVIVATFVIMKQNYKELPAYVELMHQWDIEEILLHTVLAFDESKKELLTPDYESDNYIKTMKKSKELANKYGIIFRIPVPQKPQPIENCQFPWYNIFVSSEGNVFPCCHSVFPREEKAKICMGNLLKKNFNNIWNSKKYKKFRKEMKNGEVPDLCSLCLVYKGKKLK